MMDDAELLRTFAENKSEAAFAEFVGRRIGFVYATARRQVAGDAQMAEDVAQAVFRLAAQKAPKLAAHACLAGWLYTTTSNVAWRFWRDALRRHKREQQAIFMSELQRVNECTGKIGSEGNTGAVAEVSVMRETLDDALGALREGERQAVLLRYFEGKAFAEIGAKLKMSDEAARKRVARAIEKMRGAFAKRGVASSAAALGALMTVEAAQVAPVGLAASVSAGAVTISATGATITTFAGAGGFLVFMNSSKITIAALAVFLLAAGGAYYGEQNERVSATALAQARQENVKLAAQLRDLEKRNAATAKADSAAASKQERLAAGEAFWADHPEAKEKMLTWTKAIGAMNSFRISHGLNLSPEQSAQLAEITVGPRYHITTSVPGYGDMEIVLGNPTAYSKRKQQMRDLLGETDYEKFNELSDLDDVGVKYNITGLSNALYFTNASLTSDQARSIEKIAIDLEKNHANIVDPQVRWSALMERAKPLLSSEQLRALVAAGDRYIWERTERKWIDDYNTARTVITSKRPGK